MLPSEWSRHRGGHQYLDHALRNCHFCRVKCNAVAHALVKKEKVLNGLQHTGMAGGNSRRCSDFSNIQ